MRREVGPSGLKMSISYPGERRKGKVAYEPSGPSVPELVPVTLATRSISTPPPPGWDASPSQGYPSRKYP